MPWLVFLFGLMIVPLSIVSISFVIIQPIVIGTWATLTLVAAAAMLIQVPYAIDDLIATIQFVRRRAKQGRNWLRVFLFGDADEAGGIDDSDEFGRGPFAIARDMLAGGVNLPLNLAAAGLIGASLLFTRRNLDRSVKGRLWNPRLTRPEDGRQAEQPRLRASHQLGCR